MPCLLTILKSDNFTEAIDNIEIFDNITGSPFKNKKKYFLVIAPTIDYVMLENKTYNFNTHIISSTTSGKSDVM